MQDKNNFERLIVMDRLLAIHHKEGSFSDYWIEYCEENEVPYKLVNCYQSDIIQQLADCSVLMWHWHHNDAKAILFARQLIYSVEAMGKLVFPSAKTCWHFDDKVGQKYLLEAVGAPIVPTYVFYDQQEALLWVERTTFPKVFKLRGGAGAQNVRLVENKDIAKKIIKQAFSKGFPVQNVFSDIRHKISSGRQKGELLAKVRRSPRTVTSIIRNVRSRSREKGYVYFQDFIPNNDHDIRVIVIGEHAFAIKRMCRDGDFRASGSGYIFYERNMIDERCVKRAFDVATHLDSQSVAFDFVYDSTGTPLIVEISYCFSIGGYKDCLGYWTRDLKWIEADFDARQFMIEDILDQLKA